MIAAISARKSIIALTLAVLLTGCAPTLAEMRRRPHTRRHPHDFACERCGLPVHGECHWNRVATPVERLLFWADLEDDAASGLIFLYQGCRS